jgi:hypothetical protein
MEVDGVQDDEPIGLTPGPTTDLADLMRHFAGVG